MQKIALITGATNGFGLVTARRLTEMGMQVVIVARNKMRAAESQRRIFEATGKTPDLLLVSDLGLQADVKRLAAEFRASYDRLDVLINNAGFAWTKREVTSEGFERTFALNYLAYFTLTMELVDMLIASQGRIINTASEAHRWEDIALDNLQGEKRFSKRFSPLPLMYGYTNLQRIMFTYELAERLEETGVTANTFCPGFVPVKRSQQSKLLNALSGITGRFVPAARTAEEAAETIVFLAVDPASAELNGTYHESGVLMNSAEQSYNTTIRKQLWDKTLALAGYSTDPLLAALT